MSLPDISVKQATSLRYNQEEDYKMTSSERGICLIINNVEFELDMLTKRTGSDADAFRFKEIFQQMGFQVDLKRNITSEKMRNYLKQTSACCTRKHDAVIVILLSHGTESGIYGTDGLEVDMNDILNYFDNRICSPMRGKPKVFIIQSCRGQMTDYGVKDTQFFSQPASQLTQTQINIDQSPKLLRWSQIDQTHTPTRTDMILCFSCHIGYVSTRNEEEGSLLGAVLADHLEKQSHNKHLIEILNMVSRDVKKRKSYDGNKQVLEITTIGFDKNLYFNPGLDSTNHHQVSSI